MNNLYTDAFDEYSDAQTMVSPDVTDGVGHLPALWLVGMILLLVVIRVLQPYAER